VRECSAAQEKKNARTRIGGGRYAHFADRFAAERGGRQVRARVIMSRMSLDTSKRALEGYSELCSPRTLSAIARQRQVSEDECGTR
jgi:hypothetical protein